MKPRRVQLRRTKGYRKPDGVIVVGRPSRWGNPYSVHGEIIAGANGQSWMIVGGRRARETAVNMFREHALAHPDLTNWIAPLRGHDLACWCPLDQPCHADVLLELANA